MKIVFDTDGTLTDFNKFINDNAIDYFKENYGMEVVCPEKLEVEDIFDMDNFFSKKYNCDIITAKKYTKDALNKFWVNFPRFVKFSLLSKFRDGASDFINTCIKNGHKIEVHTSRSKTTDESIVGKVARSFTYLQYKINGVKISKDAFHFYKNDDAKIKGIIDTKPDIVFEDKPEILSKLNENDIKTICINGSHNKDVQESKNLRKMDVYNEENISQILSDIIGNRSYEILNRAAKSDKFYKIIRNVRPVILSKFDPIILNKDNIISEENEKVLIAPNHRSTLDPLIITSLIDKNIHWAALKRFFDGEDSIFNNSKNGLLCKITSSGFRKLEYFPIERLRDNPHANNINAIKDMHLFLKNKQYVGIFPEGTTNKSKTEDFGVFDPAFISLAKRNDAWIQPVTMYWIKDLGIDNKVIINFAKPFKATNMTKEEAYQKYLEVQQESLNQNKELATKIKNKLIKSLKKV